MRPRNGPDTRMPLSPAESRHVEDDARRELAPPTATAAVIAYEETEEVEAAHHDEERHQGETQSVAPLDALHSEPESHAC